MQSAIHFSPLSLYHIHISTQQKIALILEHFWLSKKMPLCIILDLFKLCVLILKKNVFSVEILQHILYVMKNEGKDKTEF